MADAVVASLEVSTTSAKCILYSPAAGVIAEASRRYAAEVADGPTQDPDGVVTCALDVLREMAQAAAARGVEVSAVGLTGTWHSMLLLDADRRPLGRISTWADLSGAGHAAELRRDAGLTRKCYHATGCMVHAMYPVWKWHHTARTRPELAAAARYVSSQVEYLFEFLTGKAAVSRSTASGSGLMNIHTLDWDPDVLGFVGLRREQLAPLVEATHSEPLLAGAAAAVGLPPGTPVAVGCADGAMNQLAIGGVAGGAMSMSVGTSGALRVSHTEARIPEEPSTWCYYLMNGRRLAGAAVNNATNCVDWFLAAAGAGRLGADVYNRYSAALADVDVARAPIFMPFLFGERCPGWNEQRSGGFVVLRASHTTYDMYYAVLEGVLFNMRQCYDILVDVGGRPEQVLVSGGITNSEPWMQMAARIMRRELLVTGTANESTVGGALVALMAAGELDDAALARRRVPVTRRYEPGAGGVAGAAGGGAAVRSAGAGTAADMQRRYERYLELYALLDEDTGRS